MAELQRICLVHYHEIGLKGRNRSSFELRLVKNIEALLDGHPVESIKRISGRICIVVGAGADQDEARAITDIVSRMPGVARVSCGYRVERELEDMHEAARQALRDVGEFDSFKVTARRNHTDFPIDSMQLNQLVGAALCEAFPQARVRMRDPEVTVHVEVIQGFAYLFALSIPGVGGLPVGSSGTVVSLLSSGIDSPVASWMLARRGACVVAVHFSGRPQTAATSEELVGDIARVLERSGCIARLYVVPFGDRQRDIALEVDPKLRVIMYRRLMFRVAERIARRERAGALVTGESLGQVASQTLDNIAATNDAVSIPVLRPLIGSDKQEIIARAQAIGTFEISSQDAPDCCTLFMPRNPETHARLSAVHEGEEGLPLDAWADELVDQAEVHDFRCPGYRSRVKTREA